MMPHPETAPTLLANSIGGTFGTFLLIMGVGAVVYYFLRGKGDPPKAVGEPKKTMSSSPVKSKIFRSPYKRCPICAAPADKMTQDWDGEKKIMWTCGYCGNASVQVLKDSK
ncbi:MAG: hypothetical protein FWG02_08040 [Holophagaceae bacterium]|nr:hypothetical protein [Holophagaceae bacterium]